MKDEERVYHAPEGKLLNALIISADPGVSPTKKTTHKPGHQKVLFIFRVGAGGGQNRRQRRREEDWGSSPCWWLLNFVSIIVPRIQG